MYLGRINSIVKCHAFSSLMSSFSSIFLLFPFSLFPPLLSSLLLFSPPFLLSSCLYSRKILNRTKSEMENQGTQLLPAGSLGQVTVEVLHKITAQPPNPFSFKAINLSCCVWNSGRGKEVLEVNVSMQK